MDQIEAIKKFKYNWFANKISIKDDLNFDQKKIL